MSANRRQFLKSAGLGMAALTASPLSWAQPSAPRRPNIVLIMSDDMGYSDLGCYGGEMNTPNLDSLAASGVRFTQFYNTARCCPTRASLLSGLYPHQAGIGHMVSDQGLDGYQGNLSKNCVTIAEALKPAGYSTYMTGKWHVTKHTTADGNKDSWPLQRGFDRFYGTIQGAGSFFDPGTLTRDNTMISPFTDPEYQPKQFYYTDAISDHAARFVREHRQSKPDKPFFMYVAFTCAHWPMHALEEDIAKQKGKYSGGYEPIRRARYERMKKMGLINPAWELSPQQGDWDKCENKEWETRCMEVYAAMIDRMDQGIGRIVAALKQNNQLENTLIFFLQDNGACQEAIGRAEKMERPGKPTLSPISSDTIRLDVIPKQNRAGVPTLKGPSIMPGPEDTYISYGISWANASNTPFREYKHFVHEGGISTPLIAHWPEGIKRRGELEPQPGHLIDIMATCVDVAGAKYPAEFGGNRITPAEGRSLVPAFQGKPIEREAIFWEHEGNRALRVGKWKLVAKSPGGKWELYDMEKDRTELHDLSESDPERTKQMAAQWETWAKRTHALPWPWKPQYGQKLEESGSQAKVFDLKQGDDLPRDKAPSVAGRGFTITATIKSEKPDGVIVAQGGSAHGYALYVKGGKLAMAVRRGNKLTEVATPDKLPQNETQVIALLKKNGEITLSVAGKIVATGKAPGPLTQTPQDGLQVGDDLNGLVGEYQGSTKFSGVIQNVRIELGD